MRLTSAAPAVLTRPTETQSPVATQTAAPAVQPDKCGTMQGITSGGCVPGPSLPGPSLPGIPLPPFPGFPSKPSADAGTRATQGSQLHKIGEGVATGALTKQETETLLKEQEAIANYQRDAMADGRLSLGERFGLAVLQGRAQQNIDRATNNFSRDFFATMDMSAQVQAHQIHQIADGRTNGNITNREAGKLLGQQSSIADSRENSGPLSNLFTHVRQSEAQKDIHLHNKPGTQIDFGDFKPRPLPFPKF